MDTTPPSSSHLLPNSGREVELAMPDLYSALGAGAIPNDLLAPVLKLLDGRDLSTPGSVADLISVRDRVRGLYHMAALCLVSPRLVLKGERGEGDLAPWDLPYDDLIYIYWSFFRGGRAGAPPAGATGIGDNNRAGDTGTDGGAVAPDASGTGGSN